MAFFRSSEEKAGFTLVSPPAIYALLLLAAPLGTVLLFSVLTGGNGEVGLPITGENFWKVWTGRVYQVSCSGRCMCLFW